MKISSKGNKNVEMRLRLANNSKQEHGLSLILCYKSRNLFFNKKYL